MTRLLAWLCALAVILVAGALFIAAQALEDTPRVQRTNALSPATIGRARDVLRRNDPRRLPPNATREVRIAGPDLDALVDFAASRGIHGTARVDLRDGGASVRYTAPVPPLLARLGAGAYLNVDARLGIADERLAVEGARIGRVPVPGPLFEMLLEHAIRHSELAASLDLLKHAIARVAITPRDVAVTYVWQPALLDTARALAIAPAERERLAAAQALFADTVNRAAQNGRHVPLGAVLGPLLQEAGNRATPASRSQAYQDALLVAAAHLSGKSIAVLIPEAGRWPRPRPVTITLQGRVDLAQHFTISAALAAAGGAPLATAVGLDKEIDDAQRGSGFSFIDLTADRAGTRLGELAARDPERLAAAVAAGLTDAALLPPAADLPENMMADEFQRRFGGPDAPAFRRMSDEINRRIAALALFR